MFDKKNTEKILDGLQKLTYEVKFNKGYGPCYECKWHGDKRCDTCDQDNNKFEQKYIKCPFCGEDGFDLIGLKSHLENGDCEKYNNIKSLPRLFKG